MGNSVCSNYGVGSVS